MATLRLRNGVWYARWWTPTKGPDGRISLERVEQTTKVRGQRNKSLARTVANQLERDSIEASVAPETLTLEFAIAQYMASIEVLDRADDTLAFYERKSRPLLRILGRQTDIHRLGPQDVQRYMLTRLTERVRGKSEGAGGSEYVSEVNEHGEPLGKPISRHTVAKELGLLRSVLRWHSRQQQYEGKTDWIIPMELRAAYRPRERALSRPEFDKLYEAMTAERRDYLVAFVYTGCRDSELYKITAKDLEGHQLHIRGSKTEGSDRWTAVRPEVVEIIKRRAKRRTGQLFDRWGNVRRDLRAACARAGIPPVSPNDLRRTFASWHAESGTPEATVAKMMGHSSSAMVRRVYARIGSAAQAEAAARFPALRASKKRAKKAAKKKKKTAAKKRSTK